MIEVMMGTMSSRKNSNETIEAIIDVLYLLFGVALVIGIYSYFEFHDRPLQWFQSTFPTYSKDVFTFLEALLIPIVFAFVFFFFLQGIKRFYRISLDMAMKPKEETT